MGLRDIFLFVVVFGGLPFMLWRPYIGVLYWAWLSLMNPQALAFGYAYGFPFAQTVAIATFIGLVVGRDTVRFKLRPAVVLLALFVFWFTLTTPFAFAGEAAQAAWLRAFKVQIFTFISLAVINTKKELILFIWVIALSIGLLGVKGGLYTLRESGGGIVFGPGGFVGDNNAFAVAVIITIPLIYFLLTRVTNRWGRFALVAASGLCALSALGSHSRGALVAIGATAVFLWLKSRHKLALALALGLVAPLMLAFMPEHWEARMRTITTYETEGSAMGRLYTWGTLTRIANDRPLVGGGFEAYESAAYLDYHTAPDVPRSPHSIYFQVLGEHGYVALVLFLGIWLFTWRDASWVIQRARGREELRWAHQLAAAIQVSLVAYLVGGAFVNLGYWDMPYFLVVAIVVLQRLVSSATPPAGATSPAGEKRSSIPSSQAQGRELSAQRTTVRSGSKIE